MITMIEQILKLILSALIGFLIGKERKKQDKPGGSRTFAIISLGAALIAMISLELLVLPKGPNNVLNISRLMAYGIASMGFIGSGIVIQNKNHVQGLTSAATLYSLVPIGFCIGLGYYLIGIVSSVLLYCILELKYWIGDDE